MFSSERRALAGIAVAGTLVASVVAGAPAGADGPSDGSRVLVRRTAFGIPHVLAASYRDAGFGAGYAAAEDNLCGLADTILTVSGQRARFLGAGATTPEGVGNLDSDIYHAAVNHSGVLEAALARPEPLGPSGAARDLVAGYAAGVNRYLARHPVAALPDPACRGAAWVRPITALDVWRRITEIVTSLGGAAFAREIATATPPGSRAAGTAAPVRGRSPGLLGRGPGSNAWALGRDATADGTGMLLANPHLRWLPAERFAQLHLTIPGRLDASGATLLGLPVIVTGHTSGIAWTHTVSTAVPDTLTQLSLVPGDPARYLVDGEARPMQRRRITVQVRDTHGVRPVSRTLYRTPDGPVLAAAGLEWSAETAYVLRDANAGNVRAVDQWLAINRAQSLAGLRAAQRRHHGLPWMTTVAVERSGTVLYNDAQVVPAVSDALADRCATAQSGPVFRATRLIVLDGSRSDCGWGTDPSSVVPGLFGPDSLPSLTRTDFVANSNDSPWLTNPAAPLTAFPRIIGDTGTERSLRTRLGLDMIARRAAGTDGFGPPGFTLDTLRATMLGDRNLGAELSRPAVAALCAGAATLPDSAGSPVDVRPACAVLTRWDARATAGAPGAVLWREFFTRAVTAAGDGLWRTPFDPARPLTTPRDLNTGRGEVRTALADAVRAVTAAHLPLDAPIDAAQRHRSIGLAGCTQLEGCFNAIEPAGGLDPHGHYPGIAFGTSFLMATQLTDAGPRTRTLLLYSQSGNPASPHFLDQTRLHAAGRWVTERFTPAEIAADPALRVETLDPRDRT
ncbi:penicillin acylase family protein [Actinoplanes sp. RD1]|uniref:penicillin acylase family protein n=1 Tax=Actinoplanes sp. RD1 TaxID=3064538 RepID=UPI002741A1EC|nr:penicillin acylase family protein [Actinoplanes sp. RD1]